MILNKISHNFNSIKYYLKSYLGFYSEKEHVFFASMKEKTSVIYNSTINEYVVFYSDLHSSVGKKKKRKLSNIYIYYSYESYCSIVYNDKIIHCFHLETEKSQTYLNTGMETMR